jgi:hypothetical protein
VAHATTTGGFRVDAAASVGGRNASANAVANTSSGIVSSLSLSALANPPDSPNTTSVHAYGRVAGSFDSFPSGTAAHSSALPTLSDVTNNIFGDPNVTADYNSPDGKTPLALVALSVASIGAVPASSMTMSTSASFSFDVASLQSGELHIGLLDPISSGPAFTSLHFSITREGAVVEDQVFATPIDATTYFNDHVLDFGALKAGVTGTLDLTFLLEMTTLDNGARYGVNFLVADVGLVPGGVDGDYNDDGVVNAADYVTWRKLNGTSTVMPNDPNPLPIDNDQYVTWRGNFGASGGSGGSGDQGNVSVPEPATVMSVLLAVVLAFSSGRSNFMFSSIVT